MYHEWIKTNLVIFKAKKIASWMYERMCGTKVEVIFFIKKS